MIEQPTAAQLAHNDQVIADINRRLDALIEVHRVASEDRDMHPQVQLSGLAGYLEKHSDATSMAQFLAVAIDRLLRNSSPKASEPTARPANPFGEPHGPCVPGCVLSAPHLRQCETNTETNAGGEA